MTLRPTLIAALCATALTAPVAAQTLEGFVAQQLLSQYAPQAQPAPAPSLDSVLGGAFGVQQQPASPYGAVGQMLGVPQQPTAMGAVGQMLGVPQQQQGVAGAVGQLMGVQQQPTAMGAVGQMLGLPQPQPQQPSAVDALGQAFGLPMGQQQQPASPYGAAAGLVGGQMLGLPQQQQPLAGALGQLLGAPQQQQQPASPYGAMGQMLGLPQAAPQQQQQPGGLLGQFLGAPQGQQQQLIPPGQLFAPQPGAAVQPPFAPYPGAPVEPPAVGGPTGVTYLGGAGAAPAPAPAPAAAASTSESFGGFPRYARVTGVSANDTLKVRAEPRAQGRELGELRPDVALIETLETNADGSWTRILWQGDNAWVNSRFLAAVEPARIPGARPPVGLQCSGTEPFWSLRVQDERTLVYATPDLQPQGLALASVSPARSGGATLLTAHSAGPNRISTIIAPAQCSDGMSDATYGWRADVILSSEGSGAPPSLFSGCCRLPN